MFFMDEKEIFVLHVDDDPEYLELTQKFIHHKNSYIEITSESNPVQGLEKLKNNSFDCIVSDFKMPEMNGIELFKKIREKNDNIPFILFTNIKFSEIKNKPILKEVTDYIQKKGDSKQFKILTNRIEKSVSKNPKPQKY